MQIDCRSDRAERVLEVEMAKRVRSIRALRSCREAQAMGRATDANLRKILCGRKESLEANVAAETKRRPESP